MPRQGDVEASSLTLWQRLGAAITPDHREPILTGPEQAGGRTVAKRRWSELADVVAPGRSRNAGKRRLAGSRAVADGLPRRIAYAGGTIAPNADIAVRSARRCVAELETAGYVLRFMRPVESRRNLSNLYDFCVPQGPIAAHRPSTPPTTKGQVF